MPKTKRKSSFQRNAANRSQMREKRAARDEMVDGGFPHGSVADPVRSVLGAVGQSVSSALGSDKQMEVKAHLSKPSGPSVLGADKQMEVKAHLSKPSGPSVLDNLPKNSLDSLPKSSLDSLPKSSLDSLPNSSLDNLLDSLPDGLHENIPGALPEYVLDTANGPLPDADYTLSTLLEPTVDLRSADRMKPIEQSKHCLLTATPITDQSEMSILSETPARPFSGTWMNHIGITEEPLLASNNFIRGSFHQGDDIFSPQSRGSQCVTNSLCALIYGQNSEINSQEILDSVLTEGDSLYKEIISGLDGKQMLQSNLLSFEEIPLEVNVSNTNLNVLKSDVISGIAIQQFGASNLPTLHQSLHSSLQISNQVLIIIRGICSAVYVTNEQYHFFDSHSHGHDGLSAPDGTSILMSFCCLEDLVAYMYAFYGSMNIDMSTQFDILPLHFTTRTGMSEWKTVSHKKPRKNYSQSQGISIVCTLNNKGSSENHSKEENHSTLIGKYFKDQRERRQKRREANKRDKKTYQCLYKQKQRQCELYRKTDRQYSRESKRKARQSDEYKAKDQKCHRESLKKARQSEEYKEKDQKASREAKRMARQSDEYKAKDQKTSRESKRKARQSEEYKAKDQKCHRESLKKARQSEEYKEKDQKASREAKRMARQSDEYKAKDQKTSRESKRKARQSEEYKAKDQKCHRESLKKARQSEEYKEKDQKASREAKRMARQSDEYKAKDQKTSRESKRKARQSEEYKEKDQKASREAKRMARQSDEYKAKDQKTSRESKRKARQSEEYKAKDQKCHRESLKKARQSEEYKEKDQKASREAKRMARQSEEYKAKDQKCHRESLKKARQSEDYKAKENFNQKACKRRARLVEQYNQWEAEKKRISRQSYDFKKREIEMQNKSKKKFRMNPYNLEKERVAKQQWRSDSRNNQTEKILDCERKSLKRQNPVFHENECIATKRRKSGFDINTCIELFHKNISIGPVYVCSCCHQTWFKHSVSQVTSLSDDQQKKYLTKFISIDNKEWVCVTCRSSICGGKVPKLSVLNGMEWPKKPKELDLFPLEERLIALRIPFMQIRELPRGRQLSVKGNVVNVPVDIQPVVDALPRPFNENVTVAVKLKKKMSYKSCAFSENVRPLRVLVALHWLMKMSDLYKNANVEIDEEWIKRVTEDCNEVIHEFVSSETSNLTVGALLADESHNSEAFHENIPCNSTKPFRAESDSVSSSAKRPPSDDLYDSDAEEVSQENVGNIDTLLDDANIENRNSTFTFAPGEGQQPLSIYQDKDSEFLCFPSIYCGQKRKENDKRIVPVYYSDIAKWELRSIDRRAANSVPNIFFKLKKLQMKQLNDKVNLAVRRCQTGTNTLTAAQARDSNCIDNIVKRDEGYYLFKQIRNSPAYLETRKKDVFAMIRQLGLPTWFMSLSSADTRWTDLLKMLANLNNTVEYNDEQVDNLTWEQKIKLVQADPVTCSRYFDHRVHAFINSVLKSDHKPIGKLTDYFYRVEFQQRGSPHIHMIVWIENAPKFNVNTNAEIIAFVDEFLQCCVDDQEMKHLTDIQIHKHSRTCRKKVDKICRFGYPLPPLPCTMVLDPLEVDQDKYYKLYQNLQKKMNNQSTGYDMTYKQFLKTVVQMSEEDYIRCVRSSLKSSKVFLKRKPSEIRVNLYNKTVLKAWKANIDMQFVLDPYACAMYIVSYISKSQRGMSNLLYSAAKEARNGNMDIKRQVRHIGNVFSNSVEVSAQEAVYLVLQMPLTNSTRDVVFINTSTSDKRVQLLKSKSVLDELPADSTKIMSDNVIKRYSKRPKVLENWCLADYVSQLNIVYPEGMKTDTDDELNDDFATENEDDSPDLNNEENDSAVDSNVAKSFDDGLTLVTLKNGIKIKRRGTYKIIRYVRFSRNSDEENHFREKLLLFYPWRNEQNDLIGNFGTYKEYYESVKHTIDFKSKEYEHHVEELEQARDMAETECDAYDEIAPGTEQIEADTAEENAVESKAFVYFNPDRASEHRNYDIAIEIGCPVSAPQINPNENILPEQQYRELLRCLNTKQMHFYNHVIHWIKTKDEPLYTFLSGGAGVGKSLVIRALYQTLFRMLNLREGENAADICVLLCAYTGKAAFNINGSTISSALKQKYKQSDQTLSCDNLNTFRSKYRNLSVVIIDEISMVSNSMLNFIDQRLQELKGTRKPFGGISVIAVGDLYQLKPVSGDWIFNTSTKGAESLSLNLWKEYFTMFELTEIMRQKDDLEFAQLLNRLRNNALTEADRLQLKTCETTSTADDYHLNAPHLFAENYFMHLFNDSVISSMHAERVVVPCHDSVVSPKLSKDKQDAKIKQISTDPSKTANLHCSLTVVVDMIYDLNVNINTEDGLANGASCVVKFIEYKQAVPNRPSIIWVQFDNEKAGMETRAKFKNRGFYHDEINDNWTPIFDIQRTFTNDRRNITFERIQFPLQPSAGRSVHRAQGTTLNRVVIDLSQRRTRKVPHIHYVALSRVRSLQNLQILNFNEKALAIDEHVHTEMKRLYDEAMLNLCYIPLDTVDSLSHFKVAFNNCRSLHKHMEDVRNDHNLLSAHIIGIAETRLHQNDDTVDYNIPGYHLIRNDQETNIQANRPSHGLAIYVNDDVDVTSVLSFSSQKLEFTSLNIQHALCKMQIVVLYKSPGLSCYDLMSLLERKLVPHLDVSKPLVVIGDFNINVLHGGNDILKFMEQTFACKSHIDQPTTDSLSAIDLVFSNQNGNVGTVETYWSDHKIVYYHT